MIGFNDYRLGVLFDRQIAIRQSGMSEKAYNRSFNSLQNGLGVKWVFLFLFLLSSFLFCCNLLVGMGPRLDPIVFAVMQEPPGCKGTGNSVWMCEAHSFCEKGLISVRHIFVCIAKIWTLCVPTLSLLCV